MLSFSKDAVNLVKSHSKDMYNVSKVKKKKEVILNFILFYYTTASILTF